MSKQGQFEELVAEAMIRIVEESRIPLSGWNQSRATTVLLALSGGVDSTALLLCMSKLRQRFNLKLHAAHFNHRLRGAESDQDERYCAELTASRDIPLHKGDDVAVSARSGNERESLTSENSLRERRYRFFEETAHKIGAHFIFTGHTLDDQAETVLFRLFRGTSLTGISGMHAARELSSTTWLVRPLLSISRRQIEEYVTACGVTPRQDSSNQDVSYSRNFIRHDLMPLIVHRFPSALARIENFAGLARLDEEYLNLSARSVFAENFLDGNEWNTDWITALPKALLQRVITISLRQRKIEATSELVREIAELVSSYSDPGSRDVRFSIDKKWDIERQANQIRWLNKESIYTPHSLDYLVRLPGTTVIPPLGKALQIEQCFDPEERMKFMTEFGFQIRANLSQAEQPLLLRRRQAGDFIQPFGMHTPVSLKKYLHTHKARRFMTICCERLDPSWTVQNCIVLACGQEVLWVPGVGLSEKLRIRSSAGYVLRFLPLEPDQTNIC